MKDLYKNAGLLIILIGVIFLGIVVFTNQQTNPKLAISMILVIGGLLAHIIINRYID